MLTPRKRFYFKLIAISLPFILWVLLEMIFRLCGIGRPPFQDPYILLYSPSSIFKRVSVNGETRLRVRHSQLYSNRNLEIPEKKHAGKFRIFCVGSSASAGWPHTQEHAYSGYLNEALKLGFPEKSVEVYNISGHAYGSNRVRLVFEELMELEPDLILIYTGNNEFLEERFYQKPTRFSTGVNKVANVLRLSRVYSWTEGKVLRKLDPKSALPANHRSKNKENIQSRVFQREVDLRKNPEQFAQVLEHYEFNIKTMLQMANAKKVPVILMTVPSNLREWKPNVSSHSENFSTLESWKALYNQGRQLLFESRFPEALSVWKKVVEADPQFAESHFWLGTCHFQLKEYSEARQSFLQALDLDYNPFRALSVMNKGLRRLAEENGVPLVDLDQLFADATHQCPGYDLFLDYVHPNVPGNLIIARGVFETIQKKEWMGKSAFVLPQDFVPAVKTYEEDKDYSVLYSTLYVCGMMHQYEKMIEVSQKLLPISSETSKEMSQETLEIFPLYLEIQKQEIYGRPTPNKEEVLKRIQNFYRNPKYNYFVE